jgi:cytochrome P450
LLAGWDILPNSSEVDVGAAMMHTTLHIISRTMFSANSHEIVEVVERGVQQYQTAVRPHLLDLLGFPAWFTKRFSHRQRAVAAFDEFDSTVDELINDRAREPNNKKDLLARLVAARDVETGDGMTAQEVRDEVVTIFMAGHETTAVYTENLIRIDGGGNRLTSAHNDRAVVFYPGRRGLAVKVEEPA